MPPNPAVVVAAIAGGAGLLGGFFGGRERKKAAQREAEYKRWLFEQATFFAKDALGRMTNSVHVARQQRNEILALNLEQANAEFTKRAGFIAASAATAGVAGASVALEQAENTKTFDTTRAGVRLQKEFADVGDELRLREGRMNIRKGLTSAYPSPTNIPSNASIALGAISTGLSLASATQGLF